MLYPQRMQRLRMVAACLALGACASQAPSDDGAVTSSDAIVAGHGGIAGPVIVHPTELVVQRAGNEALLTSAGKVLVGAPEHTEGNPSGFLRRVVSAAPRGSDQLTITTVEAALGEAITSGSIATRHTIGPDALRIVPKDNASGTPSSGGLDVSVGTTVLQSAHTTFHDPTNLLPIADFALDRSVTLTRAEVHFAPTIDLAIGIEGGNVDRLDAVARGALSGSFDLVIDTKASIDIDRNPLYHDTLVKHVRSPALSYTLFETEPYALPIQFIGFVPVVETVRFRVALECDIDLASQMHLETGATVESSAAFGVHYQDGQWTPAEAPTAKATPVFAMSGLGAAAGTCDLRTEVGFYLYDLAGPTLSLSPYVSFDVASAAGTGYPFTATPGIRGAFGGRVQVLGWQLLREDISLFDVRSATPITGTL